jgi:hypothetical protein
MRAAWIAAAVLTMAVALCPPAAEATGGRQSASRFEPARRAMSRVRARRVTRTPGRRGNGLRDALHALRGLGARDAWRVLKNEFQLYRGRRLERLSDRRAYGKSDFDRSRSVAANLAALAGETGLPTFTRSIGGRDVLHIVVDLGQGKASTRAIRRVFRRVAADTIEMNFKSPGGSNTAGHVAVRVGAGATYDMTPGVSLPDPIMRSLRWVSGRDSITMARKRSLRRFLEARKDVGTPAVYYGMLFAASPEEVTGLEKTYERRLGQVKTFSYAGGDPERGEFSCAQFLTHEVPFFEQRGVHATSAARSAASGAAHSPELAAVIVYKTARTPIDELPPL